MIKDDIKSTLRKNIFFPRNHSSPPLYHQSKKRYHVDLHIILDWINYINAYRRITLFARLAWIKFWSIASQRHWLDAHHRVLGITIHDDILSLPTDFYAIFGVLIYVIRLSINLYVSLNYIFFAQDELSITERFYAECRRAHWYIIGDIVSATINLLTNFSTYFHLAAPLVSYLIIALLAFTFLKLVYFYVIEKEKYKQHEQYLVALATMDITHHHTVVLLQKQLDHQRTAMQWRLYLCIAASLFLLTSFVISITCAPQITLPLFLYMSVVGGVMYLSAENFGQFMFARKEYQHDRSAEKQAMMIEKRNLFLSILIKNVIVPIILVGLFAIHWPTALALTLLYIALLGYFAKKPQPELSPDGIPNTIRLDILPKKTYAAFFKDESIASNTAEIDKSYEARLA